MDYKKLDNVDKQILVELYKDGTQNPNQLSKKIRKDNNKYMSHVAIQKRIKKLQNANNLKVQGNINLDSLNVKTAFCLVSFKNYNYSLNYLEKHVDCPRVFLASRLTGDFQIVLGITGKDVEDINHFINCCLLSDSELIKSSSIIFTTHTCKPHFVPVNLFDTNIKKTRCGKNCTVCESYKKEICSGCVFI